MNLMFTLSVHYRIGVRKKNFNHVCNHVSSYKRTKAKTIDNISLYSTERVKTRLVILFTLFLQKEKKKNEYLKKFQQHNINKYFPYTNSLRRELGDEFLDKFAFYSSPSLQVFIFELLYIEAFIALYDAN